MDSNTTNQSDANPESNHSSINRRNRRRSIPHSIHSRPYPNSNYTHMQTWQVQNRQAERQRNYYSNYYASRNRISHVPSATSVSPTLPIANTSISTSNTSNASTVVENISINNAATQTNSASISSEETRNPVVNDSSSRSAINVSNNPPYLFDYIRTIGAFISLHGGTGRNPTFVLNAAGNGDTSNNSNNNNANSLNVNIHEPFNFDTFFGFSDNYFNDGLTKQEINRHTISYEYKQVVPAKRKRSKIDETESSTTSSTSATFHNENCSICLDKFNQSVQVRRLPCLHVFHIKCIDKWLKRNKKCPICRIAITINYDTLMSSLESGSSIDQCLVQQESSLRSQFRPTITLSLQSNRGNSEITVSGNIVHATVELNSETTVNTNPGTND